MDNFAFDALRAFYSSKIFTHIANEDNFIAEMYIVLFLHVWKKLILPKIYLHCIQYGFIIAV